MKTTAEIINSILENEGIKAATFAKNIGVVPTQIYDLQKGKIKKISDDIADKIISVYPKYNRIWLLTGGGEMFANQSSKREGVLSQNKSVPDEANYKLVPVIHVDSVGGVHSRNDIVNESQFVEGYVPFVNAQDDDRAIYQSGNSMIPTIPLGSLLQIREVPNWKEFFGYGNIFVIELTDGRRITKEINKYEENPKEYVWCHSHNPSVADEELPKNMIVSVWKVIKVLTDKGW